VAIVGWAAMLTDDLLEPEAAALLIAGDWLDMAVPNTNQGVGI